MRLDSFERTVVGGKCLDVIVFCLCDILWRGDTKDYRYFLAFDMASFRVQGALPFEFRFVLYGIAADFRGPPIFICGTVSTKFTWK